LRGDDEKDAFRSGCKRSNVHYRPLSSPRKRGPKLQGSPVWPASITDAARKPAVPTTRRTGRSVRRRSLIGRRRDLGRRWAGRAGLGRRRWRKGLEMLRRPGMRAGHADKAAGRLDQRRTRGLGCKLHRMGEWGRRDRKGHQCRSNKPSVHSAPPLQPVRATLRAGVLPWFRYRRRRGRLRAGVACVGGIAERTRSGLARLGRSPKTSPLLFKLPLLCTVPLLFSVPLVTARSEATLQPPA
jgi:hypothetical protein